MHAVAFRVSLAAGSRFRARSSPKPLPAAREARNRVARFACSQALRHPAVLSWWRGCYPAASALAGRFWRDGRALRSPLSRLLLEAHLQASTSSPYGP